MELKYEFYIHIKNNITYIKSNIHNNFSRAFLLLKFYQIKIQKQQQLQ